MARSEQESYASNQARAAQLEHRKARIRALNDDLRRLRTGGRLVLTRGVAALGNPVVIQLLQAIAAFDAFSADNDPYDLHDFGAIEIEGHRLFWKIDCYDKQLEYGSPDPSDPEVTARVLTVMLAQEY